MSIVTKQQFRKLAGVSFVPLFCLSAYFFQQVRVKQQEVALAQKNGTILKTQLFQSLNYKVEASTLAQLIQHNAKSSRTLHSLLKANWQTEYITESGGKAPAINTPANQVVTKTSNADQQEELVSAEDEIEELSDDALLDEEESLEDEGSQEAVLIQTTGKFPSYDLRDTSQKGRETPSIAEQSRKLGRGLGALKDRTIAPKATRFESTPLRDSSTDFRDTESFKDTEGFGRGLDR